MSYKYTITPDSKTLGLEQLHLSDQNKIMINQFLEEQVFLESLKKYDLPVDNKIILHGATGCGKTATALAIAKALNKKMISLNLGGFVSSRLGETAKNIMSVFRNAKLDKAVLFIDEFDFIGKRRDYDEKDSGEMKRIVNALIQLIDSIDSDTILIAATNHFDIIDTALLRRFQLRLQYDFPTQEQLDNYYNDILSKYPKELTSFDKKYNISYAEAKDWVLQNIKSNIISQEKSKSQFLFSYGTLQQENVQIENYGRKLLGEKDTLTGYKLGEIKISDTNVIEKSGKEFHPIAIKTNFKNDVIEGMIFEITYEELLETDKYEVSDYKRVLATFESGKKAWIYIENR